MSQNLDELLVEMKQNNQSTLTAEQVQQMLVQQMLYEKNSHVQLKGQQNAAQKAYSVPKKSHRKYEVIIADYDDHEVEADEIQINGNFLVFLLESKIQLITTNERVVSVMEVEE